MSDGMVCLTCGKYIGEAEWCCMCEDPVESLDGKTPMRTTGGNRNIRAAIRMVELFDQTALANDAIAELAALEARIAELEAENERLEYLVAGHRESQRIEAKIVAEAVTQANKPSAVERLVAHGALRKLQWLIDHHDKWHVELHGYRHYYGDTAEAACEAALGAMGEKP